MLGGVLVGGALVVAAGDWVAVARSHRRAEYVLKPLVPVLLIGGAVILGSDQPPARAVLTVAALILSLAGDVFLMVPGDLFLPGLGSFLLAHLAYVGAFNDSPPPAGVVLIASAAVALVAAPVYLLLLRGMTAATRRAMAVPVALYVIAIGAMVVSASVTLARPGWGTGRALVATAGAVLFMTSDGLIGWTRFVRPVPRGPVAVIVTYHLAQVALVTALLA